MIELIAQAKREIAWVITRKKTNIQTNKKIRSSLLSIHVLKWTKFPTRCKVKLVR